MTELRLTDAPTGIPPDSWKSARLFHSPTSSAPQSKLTASIVLGLAAATISATGATSTAMDLSRPMWSRFTGSSESSKLHAKSTSLPAALHSIRLESGLTWSELSRLIGVDRRTMNNWARGQRVSAANGDVIRAVIAGLREYVTPGDPAASRSRIIAPATDGGASPYSKVLAIRKPKSDLRGEYSPVDLLSLVIE